MKSEASALSMRSIACCAAAICLLQVGMTSARAQRLPANVMPTHYSLSFTPDLNAATFSGHETIRIDIKEATDAITLNAIELTFQHVEIGYGDSQTESGSVSLDALKQQATLSFPKTIPAGSATLSITFNGTLNGKLRGFYLSKTTRRNYAVTQFESTDARRAFPCFDEPALKATFEISLTIDDGDTAISNMPIATDRPGPQPGKHTVNFEKTPKMSTYLVAFLVGDFKCQREEQDGVQIGVCSAPDKTSLTPFAMDIAKSTLHYYETYFGIHYPLKKLDLVAIPDFEAGAMENFGAITFREVELLVDPATASPYNKIQVAVAITHEMAHQWFGDLVTMQWWDNVWLNEGFATWISYKPLAAAHPEWNIPEVVAAEKESALNFDAQPTTRAIRADADTPEEIEQLFDSIAYDKASDVLRMVENDLGEETFRKGVQAYLAAHLYGNATAEDFWNAQATVSHKPVDKIMESLVTQAGEPILNFAAPSAGNVVVSQSRFLLDPRIKPDPAERWTLPVCFRTIGGAQDCKLLQPDTKSLPISAGEIFFANAGGEGYYRTAYTPSQYTDLVANAEMSLTPSERIVLAGDEWALVRANKATVGDFLNLVAALKTEPNAEVLSVVLGGLNTLIDQVTSDDEERDALARWIRSSFMPQYVKLGPAVPGESSNTRELRASLFSLIAFRGNDAAISDEAHHIADQFLAYPRSIDPNLGQAALAVAAVHGDAAFFEKLQGIYETSTDPVQREGALSLLPQFEDPALLERALDYAISSKVRNQDTAFLLAIGLRIPGNRDRTWKFIKTHWQQVHAQLTTESGSVLVTYTGSFCAAQARDDVKSFFAGHPVAAAGAALQHALEHVDGCMELRELQEPNLKTWLAAQDLN